MPAPRLIPAMMGDWSSEVVTRKGRKDVTGSSVGARPGRRRCEEGAGHFSRDQALGFCRNLPQVVILKEKIGEK